MASQKALPPVWVVVTAALVCLCVGSTPVTVFSASLLVGPMTKEFGWSHAEFFGPRLVATLIATLAWPVFGALADRWGVRRLLLPGILVYGVLNACLALVGGSLWIYTALSMLTITAAYFQSPPLYMTAISMRTDRNRGLATSIALAGTGVGTAILMPVVAILIQRYGWRAAPVGLSVIMLLVALPAVYFFIREPARGAVSARGVAFAEGLTTAEALKSRNFALLMIVFFVGGAAINGIFLNMPSMFSGRGMGGAVAASALSTIALAQICGRLGSGALLDRIRSPKVGVLWFAFALIGIVLIGLSHSVELVTLGSIFIGVGLGAELELAAYYTARFFGLKNFGRLYGFLYSSFTVGTAVGPTLVGYAFDVTGGYEIALWTSVAMLVFTCLLLLALQPYRFLPEHWGQSKSTRPAVLAEPRPQAAVD